MKKKVIIGILVAVVILAFVAANILGRTGGSSGLGNRNAVEVKTVRISKGSISSVVSASGVLEEAEKASVYLEASLKVKNVPVEKYQRIKKGERLVSLDLSSYDAMPETDELKKKIKEIKHSMLSPISGIITEVNVSKGSLTNGMQAAFVIIDTDKLRARAYIKEIYLGSIKKGQKVQVTGDALGKSDRISGTVKELAPIAVKNRTATGEETVVEALVALNKKIPVMRPGLNVTCDITTKSKKDIPVVTFEMLKEDKDGNYSVFVADEKQGVIHERPVTLGITSGLNAEVSKGLKVGELVVLNPQPNYKDGMKVKTANKP